MSQSSTPLGTLLLVRHGQTSANVDGIWHGSTDAPLTDHGRAQAQCVARFLAEDAEDAGAVYVSDLLRARETAAAISAALGLEPRVEPTLREYDLGGWEGRSYRDLHEKEQLWHHMKDNPDFAPHGGESPAQVAERFTGALTRIASDHPGERVIVVTHGGALSMGLGYFLDGDYRVWRRVMENCAVSELSLHPAATLHRFNLTEHLEGLSTS